MSKVELRYNIRAETPKLCYHIGGDIMLNTTELTQAKLKKELHYNPEIGIFTHTRNKCRMARKDKIAGTINSNGYILISIKGRKYRAHRLAWLYMYGRFPEHQIDHIDHDRTNNRIDNLREITHQDNLKNKRLLDSNTSGICGVTFDKARNKWKAQINVNKRNIGIGRYSKKEDAIKARKEAEIKYGFHKNHGKDRHE